jgi:rRNA maturation protein Nop10
VSYEQIWANYRIARSVYLWSGPLTIALWVSTRWLPIPIAAVVLSGVVLIWWSAWSLESLRCPRCGERFMNLLRDRPTADHRCKSCGLQVGSPAPAR